MGRCVDRLARDRRAAFGLGTPRGLALAACVAVRSVAGDGDTPELSPPSEMPIISKPSTPTTTPTPARPVTPAPRGRAMLALPGLTTTPARPSAPLEPPNPAQGSSPGELTLDAPLEMKPLPDALPANAVANPSRAARPLVLESSPIDELTPIPAPTSRSNPTLKEPSISPKPVQTPARRPRLFGFLAPPPQPAKPIAPGRAVAADPLLHADPAVESALKRRIERQAREVVGNRARSVEVKLDGKEAVIQVTGVKVFQKRAIRKQLEGIPALSGLRSTIEVGD